MFLTNFSRAEDGPAENFFYGNAFEKVVADIFFSKKLLLSIISLQIVFADNFFRMYPTLMYRLIKLYSVSIYHCNRNTKCSPSNTSYNNSVRLITHRHELFVDKSGKKKPAIKAAGDKSRLCTRIYNSITTNCCKFYYSCTAKKLIMYVAISKFRKL